MRFIHNQGKEVFHLWSCTTNLKEKECSLHVWRERHPTLWEISWLVGGNTTKGRYRRGRSCCRLKVSGNGLVPFQIQDWRQKRIKHDSHDSYEVDGYLRLSAPNRRLLQCSQNLCIHAHKLFFLSLYLLLICWKLNVIS